MLPENIGRYQIKAEIARGAHSMVYRADDPGLGREVAVKILHLDKFPPEVRGTVFPKFEGRARALARLRHPNIIPMLDYGQSGQGLYQVIPYPTGASLKERLHGAPLELQEVARISKSLAAAIDYAHAQGVVLGNLRPANILFDQHDHDQALISTFIHDDYFDEIDFSTELESADVWSYLSPEQIGKKPVDERTDLYALGCILFEMLTGRPPERSKTRRDAITQQSDEPVAHVTDLNPGLPRLLDEAIARALAKDPAARFATAFELVQILDMAASANPPLAGIQLPTGDDGTITDNVLTGTGNAIEYPASPPPAQKPPAASPPGWTHAKPPASPPPPAPSSGAEPPGWTHAKPPEARLEKPAPGRVLNANFAGDKNRVLGRDEHLSPAKAYSLWVEIGPPWKFLSLLGDKALFPEDSQLGYLSPADRQQGWFDLEAVFVSQDFEPHLVSGRLRVPLGTTESSRPYIDGQLGAPGPLKLGLYAPGNPAKESIRARGRLCLYYGAQVLQSAVLDVGVRPAGRLPLFSKSANNHAFIDYVLTPGFEKIDTELSRRRRRVKEGQVKDTTVKVGLLLNDDNSGSHRILLKVDDKNDPAPALPPAWNTYDAAAISAALEDARRILANPSGQAPDYSSDTFLLDKFKADLTGLAKLGWNLYNMLLQGLIPAENVSTPDWRRRFRKALQPGEVIQLARAASVPSTHIIPWALVYDSPLEPGRSDLPLRLCRVVDEQWESDSARRKAPFADQEDLTCPYEAEHGTNVICPFGFWGFKYTLEQPISALLGKHWDIEPARRVLADTPVKMAVAATQDIPRESRMQQHFLAIHAAVNAEYIPASPASERDQVRDSLRAPQLVYILCHGVKDGKITTLSIGPRDQDARHTITPELPGSWSEQDYINIDQWIKTRPLVFINGCYTTDLLPELTLNFVSAFRDLLAGGVIGTEIPVTVEHGYLAGEKFFERLGRSQDLGQAILGMRWDLLNQGSLLGLAYSAYGMADLHLERGS